MLLYWDSQNYESTRQSNLQQEDESVLHAAVWKGDLTLVQALLEKKDSVISFDVDGWTPLHVAAAKGEVDILQVLLKKNPDVDVLGEGIHKSTPLSCAAKNGQAQAVRVLHEHRADTNAKDDSG